MRLILGILAFACLTIACPSLSYGQKNEEKKSVKMEDEFFERDVLFPETMKLRTDGVPHFSAEVDQVNVSIVAFRDSNFIYFQLEFINSSTNPFEFSGANFSLLDSNGFKMRGVDIGYAKATLEGADLKRDPPPPPPSNRTTTTINTTTTGNVDANGNIYSTTTGTATTTSDRDAYLAGQALGSLIGGLMSRGARKAQAALIADLASFGYNNTTIGPGEKQRVYLAYTTLKTDLVTLRLPAPFNQSVKFSMKKPKE